MLHWSATAEFVNLVRPQNHVGSLRSSHLLQRASIVFIYLVIFLFNQLVQVSTSFEARATFSKTLQVNCRDHDMR